MTEITAVCYIHGMRRILDVVFIASQNNLLSVKKFPKKIYDKFWAYKWKKTLTVCNIE